MRNVRALIAYDGSAFFGWQRQAGFHSVQQALEEALEALLGERIVVHGAGRTDTGVHALGQVAHFHVDTRLEDERLRQALNFHVRGPVVLRRLETCAGDFHARFSARSKRYGYLVATSPSRPPFARGLHHWVREPLDVGAMRRAQRLLLGRHDFSSFASSGSPRRSNVRTLTSAHLLWRRERIALLFEADGYLYNMVRALVGTLLDVGRGKLAPEELGEILRARDRRLAGATAPPDGLYLVSVQYPGRVLAAPADRPPLLAEGRESGTSAARGGSLPGTA